MRIDCKFCDNAAYQIVHEGGIATFLCPSHADAYDLNRDEVDRCWAIEAFPLAHLALKREDGYYVDFLEALVNQAVRDPIFKKNMALYDYGDQVWYWYEIVPASAGQYQGKEIVESLTNNDDYEEEDEDWMNGEIDSLRDWLAEEIVAVFGKFLEKHGVGVVVDWLEGTGDFGVILVKMKDVQ